MKIFAVVAVALALCGCIRDNGKDIADLDIKSGRITVLAYDSGEVSVCYYPDGRKGGDCKSLQLDLQR